MVEVRSTSKKLSIYTNINMSTTTDLVDRLDKLRLRKKELIDKIKAYEFELDDVARQIETVSQELAK